MIRRQLKGNEHVLKVGLGSYIGDFSSMFKPSEQIKITTPSGKIHILEPVTQDSIPIIEGNSQ
jgi:hypothetical protein